jgi:hypothetical protein
MSLLDQALSAPEVAALPAPNEHEPSTTFVALVVAVAAKLRAAGREEVSWASDGAAFSLSIGEGGRVRVSCGDDACTWVPAAETSITIRAEQKLQALDRAIVALETLTREES